MLTPTGYQLPLISEIRRDIIEAIRAKPGFEDAALEPETLEGHIVDIVAERMWKLEQKVQSVFNNTPSRAAGENLNALAAHKGLKRFPAQAPAVNIVFSGANSTVIPEGTIVRDSRQFEYRTLETTILTETCDNKVSLTFSSVPTAGSYVLTINGTAQTMLYYNPPTAHPLISSATGSHAAGYICEVTTIPTAVSVVRNPDFDAVPSSRILETTDLFKNTAGAVGVTTEAHLTRRLKVTTLPSGPAGVSHVYNIEDSSQGRDEETDAEFYARYIATPIRIGGSINGIRASLPALVNEGETDDLVTSVAVRTHYGMGPAGAPNPIEVYVQGGFTRGQKIADILGLDLASAGIDLLGDEVFTSLDIDGWPHEVRFSRPEQIDIYVNITIEAGEDFPGEDAVKDAIFDWGVRLGVGRDIIRIPGLVGALTQIQGIEDIPTLELSTDGTTFNPANVVIPDYGISIWDKTNINVTVI